MTATDKQHAHELLDRVPDDQMTAAVRSWSPFSCRRWTAPWPPRPKEDEEIAAEEEAAVARSKEWFKSNEGIPFEQVVADLGFTMDQVRSNAAEDPAA